MRFSDINNKTISVTLTDFELAKAEDNTPDKLVIRAIVEAQNDNKKISAIKMHPDFYHEFYDQIKELLSFTCDTAQKSMFWGYLIEVDEFLKKDFVLVTN